MAIYHLTCKTASRAGGQSATAHFEYIAREGKYSKRSRDRLVFCGSHNMPAWAVAEPKKYWSAADEHERSNGRLHVSVEFALPIELEEPDRIKLAQEFAQTLATSDEGKLPFSFAVHEGKGHNPHCHLMISERVLDGHHRSPDTWFKRAATGKKLAHEGGAKKTKSLMPADWLRSIREIWANLANRALTDHKKPARIDPRSNKARGITTEPGKHAGPLEFKRKRRPNTSPSVDLRSRERQIEIIRTSRELDELKRGAFAPSRKAAMSRLRGKYPAPAQTAPVRKPKPFAPEI
jgi:MobA/MobL family